jgi:NADH-quinone oxidoreductase subunit N
MSFGLFSFLLGVTKFFDQNNIIYMSDLNNFGQKNPNISIMLTILLFSMAGVPPLGGFFGKYFILLAITEYSNFALVVIALFINVISAFYYIRIIKNLWFGSKQTKCNVFFYTKD